MAIGIRSIGELAIGEGGDGVIISVPVVAVAVTTNTPVLFQQVYVPKSANVVVARFAPQLIATTFNLTLYSNVIAEDAIAMGAIGEGGVTGAATIVLTTYPEVTVDANPILITAGKSIVVPPVVVSVTTYTPAIAISATVTIPNPLSVVVVAHTPKLGLDFRWPSASVAVAGNEPLITAGKSQFVPKADVSATLNVPLVLAGAQRQVPLASVAVQAHIPAIETGLVVKAWNTLSITYKHDTIATHAIAEYEIAGGEDQTDHYPRNFRINVTPNAPFITAGKSEFVPAAHVIAATYPPQISARTRRIQVQFVAS